MTALRDLPHHDDCKQELREGITVYLCSGNCPAMYEHLLSKEAEQQEDIWDSMDDVQYEAVLSTIADNINKRLDNDA